MVVIQKMMGLAQILALPLNCCVTLVKLLDNSVMVGGLNE